MLTCVDYAGHTSNSLVDDWEKGLAIPIVIIVCLHSLEDFQLLRMKRVIRYALHRPGLLAREGGDSDRLVVKHGKQGHCLELRIR